MPGDGFVGDLEDADAIGSGCLGADLRRLVGGQVAAIGFVAGPGCVGRLVGGGVEEERCLRVAERVEEAGKVSECRPLLDPAAGVVPVVEEVVLAAERVGDAAGVGAESLETD